MDALTSTFRFSCPRRGEAVVRLSALVLPGIYTVTLNVGGEQFTQKLTVLKDPNTSGSESDIAAQTRVETALYDQMNAMSNTVNQIESLRAQLGALGKELGTDDALKRGPRK